MSPRYRNPESSGRHPITVFPRVPLFVPALLPAYSLPSTNIADTLERRQKEATLHFPFPEFTLAVTAFANISLETCPAETYLCAN
jgi:hypothetical protein